MPAVAWKADCVQTEAAVLGKIQNIVMCCLLFVPFQKDPREGDELTLVLLSMRAERATKYSLGIEVFCL